jgi:hypothetical protein
MYIKRIQTQGQGREVAQTMYTQVNKCKNDKIKKIQENSINFEKQVMQSKPKITGSY